MAIEMRWENAEQTIFFIGVEGNWTLDEYYTGHKEATAMMNNVNHPVVLIMDLTKSSAAPSKFLSTGRFSKENKSPNIGYGIMVGMPAYALALLKVLKAMFPSFGQSTAFVATLDEAHKIAREHLAAKV